MGPSAALHGGHAPPHHLRLLEAVLQLLLPQLLLDVEAEGHGALVLLAVLGVVAAKRDELLADGAAAVGLALTALGVLHHTLHLLAGRERAVGIATLAGVHQRLDAALNAQTPALLRALGGLAALAVAVIVQTETPLDHMVFVALSVVAVDAQVKVLEQKTKKKKLLNEALIKPSPDLPPTLTSPPAP